MNNKPSKICIECRGVMSPTILDGYEQGLYCHHPDDKVNFWTSRYETQQKVDALMCNDCGRIALYGRVTSNKKSGES